MESANRILIVFAHPALHKSRVNKRVLETIKNIDGVTIRDLYNSYSDYHINIKKEQEILLQHKVIIWQHPFYWYSAPALLKEWIDLVLQHGWAYGHTGNMLEGKLAMSAISTGGGIDAYSEGGYNEYTINQFLIPFERTAKLCKMKSLPPFVIHGTHLLKEPDIERIAIQYKEILISLRDNLFDVEDLMKTKYINDIIS